MNKPPLKILSRLLFITYAIVITGLSLLPSKDMPSVNLWDKLQHFAAYFIFMALVLALFNNSRARLFGAITLILYSGLLELVQALSPGRSASTADLLANALGVATAWAIAAAWQTVRKRLKRE